MPGTPNSVNGIIFIRKDILLFGSRFHLIKWFVIVYTNRYAISGVRVN